MKNVITVLAIALFTVGINAQETAASAKNPVKKESSSAKKEGRIKKSPSDQKEVGNTDVKEKCTKKSKSCCAKKM